MSMCPSSILLHRYFFFTLCVKAIPELANLTVETMLDLLLKIQVSTLPSFLPQVVDPSLTNFTPIPNSCANTCKLNAARSLNAAGDGGIVSLSFDAAKFNHSCVPNTTVMVCPYQPERDDIPQAHLSYRNKSWALVEMHSARNLIEGEQLFITYLTPLQLLTMGRTERQDLIARTWHFKCNCPRCQLGDTEIRTQLEVEHTQKRQRTEPAISSEETSSRETEKATATPRYVEERCTIQI
jgi:hypothetical protein